MDNNLQGVKKWLMNPSGGSIFDNLNICQCRPKRAYGEKNEKNREFVGNISHPWGGGKGYVLGRRQCGKLKQQFVFVIKLFC